MYPSDKHPRLYASGAAKKRVNKKRRLDNAVTDASKIQSFFVTTTAGEDETFEGNPENRKRDAVDVAPSVPAPEDEAAVEPAPGNEAAAESRTGGTSNGGTSTTMTGSSGVRPDARQPGGSRSLSTGHIANRTENDNPSSQSMPPKRNVCYHQRERQQTHVLGKKHSMHFLGAVQLERQWP